MEATFYETMRERQSGYTTRRRSGRGKIAAFTESNFPRGKVIRAKTVQGIRPEGFPIKTPPRPRSRNPLFRPLTPAHRRYDVLTCACVQDVCLSARASACVGALIKIPSVRPGLIALFFFRRSLPRRPSPRSVYPRPRPRTHPVPARHRALAGP